MCDDYTINEHNHRFAAWAAGRAASVKGCRFSVEEGRQWLEAAGFTLAFSDPDNLPDPANFDASHRRWRAGIIAAAANSGKKLTHGVAAKLINVYLKARFVCGGFANHENVAALHPPIDQLLLDELGKQDFGGQRRFWRRASRAAWSKFDGPQYEEVIDGIRGGLNNEPMWMIEQFWVGHQ